MIQKVIESSPGMATYMDTKGLVLFMQKKYDEAFVMFDEALKLNSKQPDINEHLGDAYFKRNLIDKALEYWNIAKELGSENKNLTKKIESKNYYEPIYD
jgi:tetratricopeptide (TPR) repeat protein